MFKQQIFSHKDSAWIVWLRVSYEIALKLLAKTTVSEDLTEAGGSTSKIIHQAVGKSLQFTAMWSFLYDFP